MNNQDESAHRRAIVTACILLAGIAPLVLGQPEAKAQQAPEAPASPAVEQAPAAVEEAPAAVEEAPAVVEEAPAVDPEEPSAPSAGALAPEELQALVAPIALYPDLVLVLTLQASLAPLDVVQAARFLERYAQDPSLTPDPDWDQSVVGLLNYPTVIHQMNADLDWTQTLGQAVLGQLEGVQDAVQDVRSFMRAVGGLESNDKMTIVVEDDNISIRPTDPDAVFIPQYDPEALLTALYSTAEAPAAEPAAVGAEAAAPEAAAVASEPAEPAPAPSAAEPAPAPAPETQAVPAAAPAYPAPGYYPPPPMTYSDPSPSWLGTAATFAGGAVVGGLVGWAIADDDDDDHDHGDSNSSSNSSSRGNVNIEDSTITVNRGGGAEGNADDLKLRAENERLKRDAQVKEQREQTKKELNQKYAQTQPGAPATRAAAPATRSKPSGLATSGARKSPATATRASPGGKELTGRVDQAKAKAKPASSAQARPAAASSKTALRAGDRKQPQAASAFGGTKSASAAKRDSNRGLQSRTGAKTEIKPNRGGGGGSAFAQRESGGGKAAGSGKQRGSQSRRGKR